MEADISSLRAIAAPCLCWAIINTDDVATSTILTPGNLVRTGAYIRAGEDAEMKCYIRLLNNGVVRLTAETENSDKLSPYYIVVEAPTSVTSISASNSDVPYYDLQGRRLNAPPVRPGVYIYKGKKVVGGARL